MAMKHVELIQNLVNHIEANLAEDINITALADSFWISSWHFQRLFKSLVSDTLGGYVRGRRLTAAARLLLETRKGIIDIALDVGFTTPEAFSRSFKAYFEQTPKAFRAQKNQVFLTEKPLLTMAQFEHISQDIQREPEIIEWPALNLVGFETTIPSPFSVDTPYCTTLFESWKKLITTQNEIPNRLSANFYGMTISPSGQFTESELRFMYDAERHLITATWPLRLTDPHPAPLAQLHQANQFGLLSCFSLLHFDVKHYRVLRLHYASIAIIQSCPNMKYNCVQGTSIGSNGHKKT